MRGRVIASSVAGAVLLVGCGADDDVPVITAPVTTSPVTTSPVTTSPVNTSPVNTSPVNTSSVITSPVTTSPVVETTAPTAPWDGEWRAVAGTVDGEPVDLIGDITLTIDGTTFSGSAACNSYEYTAEVTGDTAEFVEGFVTGMGCDGELMELEATYLGSIGPTATLANEGGLLRLTGPASAWVFERVPPVADVPFVGTRWQLDSLLDGGGASFVIGMDNASLIFADDGTVTGSTSCRSLTASWRMDGERVVTSDLVVTGTCDGLLVDVDEAVLALLDDGFVPEIDEDRLRAMTDDDTGIAFRVA
jgi:heat shock protein HslJ